MIRLIKGCPVIPGKARGQSICSNIPISFWGGIDAHNGKIVDIHHDLCGQCITGKILFIPGGRGSCSGSGIMLEMIRARTAPAAIISIEAEPIIAIGSVIGRELYGRVVPLYTINSQDYKTIISGTIISLEKDGTIEIGYP
jgi:predicted aconitase with swiveling domain